MGPSRGDRRITVSSRLTGLYANAPDLTRSHGQIDAPTSPTDQTRLFLRPTGIELRSLKSIAREHQAPRRRVSPRQNESQPHPTPETHAAVAMTHPRKRSLSVHLQAGWHAAPDDPPGELHTPHHPLYIHTPTPHHHPSTVSRLVANGRECAQPGPACARPPITDPHVLESEAYVMGISQEPAL